MSDTKGEKQPLFTKVKAMTLTGIKAATEPEEEYEVVWRCYSCGVTSETGTFCTETTWTDWGTEYECVCNTCGSELTAMDGEGTPQCDCGNYDWYCYKCNKSMCQECWKWFDVPEEPNEYLCTKCGPPTPGGDTLAPQP